MVAPLGRVQAVGTGLPGSPDLWNFYWNGAVAGVFDAADATAAIAAVRTLFNSVSLCFQSAHSIQVSPIVEVFEATTGALISTVTGTAVAAVIGTGTGTPLTAEGPLLQWHTGLVVGRKLLRGRTFLVPSMSGTLDLSGSVTAARIV